MSHAQLLNKLLNALLLDNGAAIPQGPFGNNDPNLRFYRFTNTESPELLQFFFPEREGLTHLRNTSPDAFDRDGEGCDLAPVYYALYNRFDAYWNDCVEWVERNLANSNAVQYHCFRNRGNLPNSKEDLKASLIKYERIDTTVHEINDIFSQDPSVCSFMDAHGGGTVVLNDLTIKRQGEKDMVAAIVAITMIWLAQLDTSAPGCAAFRRRLYNKIRLLFLEDDPRILEEHDFHEISNFAALDLLAEHYGLTGSCEKVDSMVDYLGRDRMRSFLEILKNDMLNLTNHADVRSDDVKQRTLSIENLHNEEK